MSRIDDTKEFLPVRIAVLTVSDTRQMADDRSGQTLVDRIAASGRLRSGHFRADFAAALATTRPCARN